MEQMHIFNTHVCVQPKNTCEACFMGGKPVSLLTHFYLVFSLLFRNIPVGCCRRNELFLYSSPDRHVLIPYCALLPGHACLYNSRPQKRTLPAVKEIQRLLKRQVRSGRASEVLKVLDTVREEHGPEGVGLTYVYQLAMEACILESRWRDALTLFDEVGNRQKSCIFPFICLSVCPSGHVLGVHS